MYLFDKPDGLRGLTKIGMAITPTVKRQIGATTINIDSKDINKFFNITLSIAGNFFISMRIYI